MSCRAFQLFSLTLLRARVSTNSFTSTPPGRRIRKQKLNPSTVNTTHGPASIKIDLDPKINTDVPAAARTVAIVNEYCLYVNSFNIVRTINKISAETRTRYPKITK